MAEGRQLFSYKGVEYDLPASYTPQQALARIKNHLGESSAPAKQVAPQVPTTKPEISGWRKFTEGVGSGLAMGDKAAAYRKLQENKIGSKKYLEGKAQLERLGMADTSDDSWQSIAGKVLGGGAISALDFVTGGGVTEGSGAAEEYLRRAKQTEDARIKAANKYGTAVGLSTAVGGIVGQGPNRLATAAKQGLANAVTGAVPEMEMGRKPTIESVGLDAVTGGILGAATHTKVKQTKPTAAVPDVDSRLDARINQQLQTQMEKANANKNLTPADIDTPAPAGTNFEMQLPGGKGTKAGRKAYERQQKVRGDAGAEEQVVGLTPEEQAAQSELFTQQDMFQPDTIPQSLLVENQRAPEGSSFMPDFENQIPESLLQKQKEPGSSYIQDSDLPIVGQEKVYDTAPQQSLFTGEEPPLQSLATRSPEQKIAGDFAVRELVDQNGNSLFDGLPTGQQKVIGDTYNSIAKKRVQGGFVDPKVFVEGFKAGFDLIARGVKSFATFAKELATKFGDAIKPYLPQIWSGSNKHIKQTKQSSMSFIQKHGVPLREAFNNIKDARSLELMSEATVALANVKDTFKRTVYDQQYSGDPLSSGIKWGKSAPLVRFFKNPARDSMLTKYAKFMNSGEVIDPRKLGWSKSEIEAYLDLRDALDTIGSMEGIDITANPNYFPRMRIGKYVAIARDAQGNPHIEAADGLSSFALARKLEKEGYTVEAHGTKADIYSNPQYRSMLAGDFLAEGYVPDPFSAHRKEAGNISGWTGQRGDPKDLLRAVEIYLKRAENGLQREAILPIVKKIQQELPADKAEAMIKYLEKAVGLEFLHTPQFLRDIENGLNKLPGFNQHDKVINGMSKAFYWLKVIPGMANGIQALMSAPMFAPQQLMRLTDQGVSAPKALSHITKSTIGSLLGIDNPRNLEIASRAERSGYIQNPTDLIGISQKLGRGKLANQAAEMLYDPFRASRLEMKARKDFMVGMYNYYVHEMKLDSESAFHRAGQNTLDAFVNLHPEDRAPWQAGLGTMGRPLSALTTYPIGMASKIYQNIGRNTTPGQKKALVAITLGAVLAGGLRGAPVTDLMEALTFAYNLLQNDEEQLGSFDDMLLQLGEKYPDFGWVLNGIPSQVLGVDMSRSLGWPGLSTLIPYWAQVQDVAKSASNAAFGTEFRSDGLVPPALSGMGNFAKGAYDLAKNEMQGGMNEGEREAAWQAVLPRALQKMEDTPNVYTKKGDLVGTVSPEAQEAAKLTGTRSLEEATMRANESQLIKQEKGVQNLKKQVLDDIVRTALYNKTMDKEKLANRISRLGKLSAGIDQADVMEAIYQEILTSKANPQQRALMNADTVRVILEYKQKQQFAMGE